VDEETDEIRTRRLEHERKRSERFMRVGHEGPASLPAEPSPGPVAPPANVARLIVNGQKHSLRPERAIQPTLATVSIRTSY